MSSRGGQFRSTLCRDSPAFQVVRLSAMQKRGSFQNFRGLLAAVQVPAALMANQSCSPVWYTVLAVLKSTGDDRPEAISFEALVRDGQPGQTHHPFVDSD